MKRKSLIKRLIRLIYAALLIGLLPASALAASVSDTYAWFYNGAGVNVKGWQVAMYNSQTKGYLYFEDPTYTDKALRGHIRYQAKEHGSGTLDEEVRVTYYNNDWDYGYYLWKLDPYTEDCGITADPGYVFSHYEITYWYPVVSGNRVSLHEVTGRYEPGDYIPIDTTLQYKWEKQRGYLEVYLVFTEDPDYVPEPEKPAAEALDQLLGELVEVRCTAASSHQAARYPLDTTLLTETDVSQGSYTLSGSLSGESYAAQYSQDTGKQHALVSSQPVQISVTLTYQDGAWKVASEKPAAIFDTICQPDTSPSDTSPSDTTPSDTTPSDTSPSVTQPSDTSPSGTSPVPTPSESSIASAGTDPTGITEPSDTAATSTSAATASATSTTTATASAEKSAPKTGDLSSPALAVIALALSGLGLAVLIYRRRARSQR